MTKPVLSLECLDLNKARIVSWQDYKYVHARQVPNQL